MRPAQTRAGSVKNRHREETTRQPSSILIVGSGFAGFECARRLSRLLQRHRSNATVTLISPVDYLLYTPLLPEVAGGAIDPRFATVPLIDVLPGVRLFRAYVDSVDLSARSLHCRDQENTSHELSWDRLVLTPGSISRLFDIPGLAQSLARFSASEKFIPASAVMHPRDHQMYADDLRYQKASADPTTVPSHSD